MNFPGGSLFSRLRTQSGDTWQAYANHPFVEGMADGSLPQAAFRHYLAQDYLFLIEFARAWALAGYKAECLDEIKAASDGLKTIVDVEMGLHVGYCAEWGISQEALEQTPSAPAMRNYTDYVMKCGENGDLLDLHVALSPCIIGYGEIGARLAAAPNDGVAGNPYWPWIEMYGGAEYQAAAHSEAKTLDQLAASRGGEARFDSLAAIFNEATRLETEFWQMGINAIDAGSGMRVRHA